MELRRSQETSDVRLALALASGCPKPVKEPGTVSKRKAIATGWSRLNRKAKTGVRKFRRSKSAKTAVAADYAMMIAATHNEPGAALAAALRAVELKPTRLRLLNAAELLTDVGLPREALALVKAAGRLKPAAVSAMGIPTAPDIALAKGNALLALGRYPAAIMALTAASATELEQEAGRARWPPPTSATSRSQRRGSRQSATPADNHRLKSYDSFNGTAERADPSVVLDMSKGVDQPFATFAVPGESGAHDRIGRHAGRGPPRPPIDRWVALRQQANAVYQALPPAMLYRTSLSALRVQNLIVYFTQIDAFMPGWAASIRPPSLRRGR